MVEREVTTEPWICSKEVFFALAVARTKVHKPTHGVDVDCSRWHEHRDSAGPFADHGQRELKDRVSTRDLLPVVYLLIITISIKSNMNTHPRRKHAVAAVDAGVECVEDESAHRRITHPPHTHIVIIDVPQNVLRVARHGAEYRIALL